MSVVRVPNGSLPPKAFTHGPAIPSPFPTITAAFYHQVSANPTSIAAKDLSAGEEKERQISYEDLAQKVAWASRRLVDAGVRPRDRVPLVVKRGISMLVGIFAILSCGAQYIPLDGGVVPDATLSHILGQVDPRVVVCLSSTKHRLENSGRKIEAVVLDEGPEDSSAQNINLARPGFGCYIIYTSGTTGAPKGVNVTHKNAANLLCLYPGNLGIGPGTKVGQVLNISFDMAAWEILGCLCNGGTLIIRGSDWDATIRQIQVLICTLSILARYNPETLRNIKVVATAGEPSSESLADAWAQNGKYFNCCGPTETTIVNTMHEHDVGTPLSIGRPTPNNMVYILDNEGLPVTVGETGVMWAGGDGITKGYINQAALTQDKYKIDTFSDDGTIMYNTGDLGRWREDGLIDILGRVDDQVKVKGFRIELDGVSASMATFPGVARAAALLVGGEIQGFVAPKVAEPETMKRHLETRQPYYAIPSRFYFLDELPATANGKIDKKALRNLTQQRDMMAGTVEQAELGVAAADMEAQSMVVPEESPEGSVDGSSTDMEADSEMLMGGKKEDVDLDAAIPGKTTGQPFRGLRRRVFIVYRQIFTLVGLANLAGLLAVFLTTAADRRTLGTMTAANLAAAVLIRQDFVINLLYTVACSVPPSWPFWIRKCAANIYHLGGMHSGAAVCAGAWLLAATVADVACDMMADSCPASWQQQAQSTAAKVMAWDLLTLFAVMFTFAWPSFRKKHHNLFERTHRFVGWTMLALFWAQTIVSANDYKSRDEALGLALVRTPAFWMLLAATFSVATSWLFLRRVSVQAEVLSDHAVQLHFDYTVPVNGSFARLSTSPLAEWHSFATIPAPVADLDSGFPRGYSVVVSNAGDWTQRCIRNPPSQLWVRGVPTCGVMRIAPLFRRITIVATGSGIGPLLGHIHAPTCETRLIWSAPRPELTFGFSLVEDIRSKIPHAVIHDTRLDGRPDLLKMAYNMAKNFNSEAVIIISNEKITKKVVYGLQTRGVAAYGAIWDS